MTQNTPHSPPARPLSPHLQIYRSQLTSVLSIIHRLTGITLSLGTVFLVIWLGSIAEGPQTYQAISVWSSSAFGKTFLLGWAFCFYFHLANGIRHLFWDVGWGYELKDVYRSGWTALGFAFTLTFLTLLWIL